MLLHEPDDDDDDEVASDRIENINETINRKKENDSEPRAIVTPNSTNLQKNHPNRRKSSVRGMVTQLSIQVN